MPRFTLALDSETDLRILEVRHAPGLFQLVDVNRDHLRPWLPWVDATRRTADIRVFIRAGLKQFADGNGFHTGIWHQGELAGVVGHKKIDWAHRSGALGYWLAREHQGKGLMTAAVRALTAHAFEELELNRLEIRCAPENRRSRAIPERLGFREEGRIREAEHLYGRYVDHIVYGMLAREWPPAESPPGS